MEDDARVPRLVSVIRKFPLISSEYADDGVRLMPRDLVEVVEPIWMLPLSEMSLLFFR